ncbi:hypothetical protein ACF0H5_021213 [Mactra antiquata]
MNKLVAGTEIAYAAVKDITIRPFRKRPPSLQYNIRLHEEEFNISLIRNTGLTAPGCIEQHYELSGVKKLYPCAYQDLDCYYTGKSDSHNESWVAAYVCDGLRGVLSIENMSYFFDPLNSNSSIINGGQAHTVYKFEGKFMDTCGVSDIRTESVHHARHKKDVNDQLNVKYVELRLVIDPYMVYYHHSIEKAKQHAYMALNIANKVYHHKSLGQTIQLVLKEFHYIKSLNEDLASNLSPNVEESLKAFCEWQDKQTNNVDANILITRLNLRDKLSDSVTGYSYTRGICKKSWNCAIVEDTGPIVGITLAHELGHLLGMYHDTGPSDIGIMSAGGWSGLEAFLWSKKSATDFFLFSQFRPDPMECLRNSPMQIPNKGDSVLPGLVHSAEDQCRFMFNRSAFYAPETVPIEADTCANMHCGFESGVSLVSGPLMDGTDCYNNRSWCMNGQCVPMGIQHVGLPSIDGGWSEWSSFTPCSRSCNGGIRLKKRRCNKPMPQFGGKSCVGEATQAQICNFGACGVNEGDDRMKQCKPNGNLNDQSCCNNNPGTSSCMYFMCSGNSCSTNITGCSMHKYADGTKCLLHDTSSHSYSRCVGGLCRPFGCDGLSESTLRYDNCGTCNGNGSTCEKHTGSFDGLGVYKAYVDVATIPKGSFNVVVYEMNPFCFLSALLNGKRLLNVNGTQDGSLTTSKAFGLEITYNTIPERLEITGKLSTDIVIQVYRTYSNDYNDVYPNVTYSYNTEKHDLKQMYAWATIPTLGCPVSCGTGEKEDTIECKTSGFVTVDDYHCNIEDKPSLMPRQCNTHTCPPRWAVSEWSNCSVPCGLGTRSRNVSCVEEVNGKLVVTDVSKCHVLQHPTYESRCYISNCTGYWATGNWSYCSRTCGEGFKRRNVTCNANYNNNTYVLAESECDQQHRPTGISKCNHGPCYIESEQGQTCEDKGNDCKQWYDTDIIICDGTIRPYMSTNCTKTCGICTYNVCNDKESCISFRGNDCRTVKNVTEMVRLFQDCPDKCGLCNEPAKCYDDDRCSAYDPVYCTDPLYARWMYRNCPQTCGVCRDCTDCNKYDTAKYCNNPNSITYMKKYCAKTCKFC